MADVFERLEQECSWLSSSGAEAYIADTMVRYAVLTRQSDGWPLHCRGELPNIRGMFTALRYFDISNNSLSGFIPQAWADTGIIRLVRFSTIRVYFRFCRRFCWCLFCRRLSSRCPPGLLRFCCIDGE